MRSIQDDEPDNRSVGSDISCYSRWIVVNESMWVPSGDAMLSDHRYLDLALNHPV